MKQILFMAALFAITLTACGDKTKDAADAPKPAATNSANAPLPAAPKPDTPIKNDMGSIGAAPPMVPPDRKADGSPPSKIGRPAGTPGVK